MTEEVKADIKEEETAPAVVEPSQEEQDPVKAELERVETKPKRTRLETLAYNRDRLEKEIEAEKAKLGVVDDDDDTRPLTVGELKRLRAEEGLQSAVTLAEAIEDEHERKLVKHYLENSIKPSGDAHEDLRLAKAMVNAVKNRQVAEDTVRKTTPRTTSTSSGAPAKETTPASELTKEDAAIARGFGLTPEEAQKALEQ